MNKTELESKHLSELHALAAEAGVERYRMLPRAELIEKLAGGGTPAAKPRNGRRGEPGRGRQRDRKPRRERQGKPAPERQAEPQRAERPAPAAAGGDRPRRKRRRRWGRRRKGVRVHDLLLPPVPGRQAIVHAESRAGCTALLRELAAEIAGASKGPDPVALLIDPSPEELADWRREAPQAEIVAAGQARHASDAVAQATLRARDGEDVILLIDSLSRFAESFGDTEEVKALFDAGREPTAKGTLTVVAALERS